jgi:hypothetical protein
MDVEKKNIIILWARLAGSNSSCILNFNVHKGELEEGERAGWPGRRT